MISVSILYPHQEGVTFNTAYYFEKHIPLAQARLGAALKGVTIEQGLGGGAPGTPPAFVMIARLLFESLETFQAAFNPCAAELTGDIPNYAPIPPIIQISEVKV